MRRSRLAVSLVTVAACTLTALIGRAEEASNGWAEYRGSAMALRTPDEGRPGDEGSVASTSRSDGSSPTSAAIDPADGPARASVSDGADPTTTVAHPPAPTTTARPASGATDSAGSSGGARQPGPTTTSPWRSLPSPGTTTSWAAREQAAALPPTLSTYQTTLGPASDQNTWALGDGFTVGVTHSQYSADSWFAAPAVTSAESTLRAVAPLQNQHIMGWGALNPEPSPGVFDWSSLDLRIDLIRRTGGVPVITLCCAPDWMKGGTPGQTDWMRLESAPTRGHYADFAALSAAVAARYPDVPYFQVWNELKGFYDASRNRWDHEAYTDLYNAVYDAVKQVRPDARIGGPYVPIDSWPDRGASHPSALEGPWGVVDQRSLDVIDYWLAHAHGADFLTVDGGAILKTGNAITDPFTANDKLSTVTRWIRSRTSLPIWWAEVYAMPANTAPESADLMIDLLSKLRSAGANVVLLWNPNGDGDTCDNCLWYDIRTAAGGRPAPLVARLTTAGLVSPVRTPPPSRPGG